MTGGLDILFPQSIGVLNDIFLLVTRQDRGSITQQRRNLDSIASSGDHRLPSRQVDANWPFADLHGRLLLL